MLGVWCAQRCRGLHDEVVEDVAVGQRSVSVWISVDIVVCKIVTP